MLPEVCFLRYSFPCARVLVDVRKTLSEAEWEKMKQAVETDTPMSREYLEKTFPLAIQRIKKINPDPWNVDTIRDYFWNKHEAELSTDLPPMIKRLCVVKKGVLEKQIGNAFRVNLGENDVRVITALYKNPQVGDTVMVHYGYASEKV